MDLYQKKFDKEGMKTAMLKHEETFRHQLHELHRLYSVQRELMRSMKIELKRPRKPKQYDDNNLEHPLEDDAEDCETDLELTLGCGKKKREEASCTSDSGEASSSSIWMPELTIGYTNGVYGSRQHPPWLTQCLRLNMA